MARGTNFTVSVTDNRRKIYPNACRVAEEMQTHLSNVFLGALETVINQNNLQNKSAKYIEWAIEGIRLGMEGGEDNG